MTLSVKINTEILATLLSQNDLAGASALVHMTKNTNYADGSAAGLAHLVFASNRTLAASASENLDLAGGGLLDPNNAALTFATVRAIYVRANDTNVDDVVVGGAATNAFVGPFGSATDKMHVKPGCEFLIYAQDTGWTVTAGTGDLLKVADGGAAGVKYEIVIIGA